MERRKYYDGPTSVVEETTEIFRPRRSFSRPPSRSATVVTLPTESSAVISHRLSESEESDYRGADTRQRFRRDSSQARGRSRSQSRRHHRRQTSRHGDDEGKRCIAFVCHNTIEHHDLHIYRPSGLSSTPLHRSSIPSTSTSIQIFIAWVHESA